MSGACDVWPAGRIYAHQVMGVVALCSIQCGRCSCALAWPSRNCCCCCCRCRCGQQDTAASAHGRGCVAEAFTTPTTHRQKARSRSRPGKHTAAITQHATLLSPTRPGCPLIHSCQRRRHRVRVTTARQHCPGQLPSPAARRRLPGTPCLLQVMLHQAATPPHTAPARAPYPAWSTSGKVSGRTLSARASSGQ